MKTATLDALTEKLERIQHLDPQSFAAFDTIADSVITRIKEHRRIERVGRGRLLSRLQTRHDCQLPDGGRFEQIEPLGRVRQWRCVGCDVIVTLD